MQSMEGGSTIGDGDGGGHCAHLNRCLRLKAAFAGSVNFLANTAFTARAAIPACGALVMVRLVEWHWWWMRLMGSFGSGCNRGNRYDGSSGSSSWLVHPPNLPLPLLFTSAPELGAGAGVGGGADNRRIGRCWLLLLCGDGSNWKKHLPPKTVSWEQLFGNHCHPTRFMEGPFYPQNEHLHDPREQLRPQNTSSELFLSIDNK